MPGRMQGLENLVWKDYLQHPAYVINDAVAAMMAEAKFGSAKTKKHVVMLTLGTGVGGAIMIDGKPYQGAFNKAGHIGHMVIDDEGDCDVTGMPGSLEECIGNCTIKKRSKGRFESTHELLDSYRKGDQLANEVWIKSIRQLAIGLASVTNILSPEVIVLGGGITEAGKDLFEPLQKFMEQYEWRTGGNKVEIVKATYGDLAGAIGAACFAMTKEN
jgi:glucokinase